MSASTKKVICVTVCDHWIGYGIARSLLLSQNKDSDYTIRAIGRDMRCMKILEEFGAEVIQINYENHETIEHACQDCTWMIMISEMDENRVTMAKTFVDVCKKVDVKNLCFLSTLGANDAKKKSLCDFREMERCVESTVDYWTILRLSFLDQRLHHFAQDVSEKGVLPLPIRSQDSMAPIHFDDLQCVLVHLMFREDGTFIPRMDSKHQRKHYTLTGPEIVNGEMMVNMLNKVLDREDEEKITFEEITREESEEYLKSPCDEINEFTTGMIGSLLQKFKHLWSGAPDSEGDDVKKQEKKDDTEDLTPPLCPCDMEIEIILDFFDYVKEGKANHVSGDFKKITGEEPKRLVDFFKSHRDEFDRRRQ